MNVNIQSIDALSQLKHGIARYVHEVVAPLETLEREAVRTSEWLIERRRHWQKQIESQQQALRLAQAALSHCESTAYRDAKSGSVYRPDCSTQRAAVSQAIGRLRHVEIELQKTDEAKRSVERVYQEFRRQRQHFQGYLSHEVVESQVFLEHCLSTLRAYAATGASSTPTLTDNVTTPITESVAAPIDVLTETFHVGLLAGAVGLTGVAVAAINMMAGHLQTNLGNTGENLVESLLQKKWGWQVLPFDQPKHGCDRVFTAPGLPLIIVECKVNRMGELRLGQTKHGEQASPAWIAAQSKAMADPTSAQYSVQNAALAALVEELGPENIPTIAVVITTATGAVDIHWRRAHGAEWEHLAADVDLTTLLQREFGGGEKPYTAEYMAGPNNYPPEFREGNFGGPERRG